MAMNDSRGECHGLSVCDAARAARRPAAADGTGACRAASTKASAARHSGALAAAIPKSSSKRGAKRGSE